MSLLDSTYGANEPRRKEINHHHGGDGLPTDGHSTSNYDNRGNKTAPSHEFCNKRKYEDHTDRIRPNHRK
ncbi:hypothetical protein TKK_0017094 [Trichogramma kaykai]